MFWRWLILFSLMLLTAGTWAEDLGMIGPTYAIAERDLIEVIHAKLRRAQETGELARIQESYKRGVVASFEHPKPIPGIQPAQLARTHYIDPTWVLGRNVIDDKGRRLYPAGTRVNPFDFDHLSQSLLFFDERDRRQVSLARSLMDKSAVPVKPILIAGEPFKLMHEWKREVFFDQGGVLSRRFEITHSPALVTQEGKRLRIDEISP